MTTTIQKWGNSYAVRIPKGAIDALNLHEGQSVQIEATIKNKTLSITATQQKDLPLSVLIAGITPKNRHAEVDWGGSVGNEAW
jgi:antitoxin MazE